MHLSLLSDSYLSDNLNDAGVQPRALANDPSHFAALCRGLVVVAALSAPLGLTFLAQAGPNGWAASAAERLNATGPRGAR